MAKIEEIIQALVATSSKNQKLAILQGEKKNVLLQKVCRMAYDPFLNFYIRKIPTYKPHITNRLLCLSLDAALNQLRDVLSTREKTGNAAIEFLAELLSNMVPSEATIIERVIGKDLRCGMSESTINKVWPKLIPTYPVMLCSTFDQKLVDKIGFPAIFQLKADGMRFNAVVKNGSVSYFTRNGNALDLKGKLDQFFIEMGNGTNVVFDGELLILSKDGKALPRQTGNGILVKCQRGTLSEGEADQIAASLWDLITYDQFSGKDGNYECYEERLTQLVSCWKRNRPAKISIIETNYVENMEQVQDLYGKYRADGLEGGVLKHPQALWEDKRSKNQIKFKAELDCDLKCVGVEEGTGKNKGKVGALLLESSDGIVKVGCGSGLKALDREKPFSFYVDQIIAIKYNNRIVDKRTGCSSLFLPIFIEVRSDKSKADSSKDIK